MDRLVLKCSIKGEPAIIYIDFRDPVQITEFPRMTVECAEGLFDSMTGEVWEGPREELQEEPNLAPSVELIEVEEDEDDEEDDDEDE